MRNPDKIEILTAWDLAVKDWKEPTEDLVHKSTHAYHYQVLRRFGLLLPWQTSLGR